MLNDHYTAAQTGAAVIEAVWSGIVKLTGEDRISWLQGMVTNDIEKLGAGAGCYAGHLTPQGKLVAHMHVLADDDALWLSLERSALPKLISAFDKLLIMEDVQVADVSEEWTVMGLAGPNARAAIERWIGRPLDIGSRYSHRQLNGYRVVASDLGFDVWTSPERAEDVLRALKRGGATAIDRATWEVLRTEAGMPIYGVDIDETTTMPELGERGISYEKGCFVGQEVVAKVKYIGHVNRRFVGLLLEGSGPPATKSIVRKSGKNVGYITTSVFSPRLQRPIALGFVARAASAQGTEVEIVSRDLAVKATVAALPFKF